MPKDKPNSPLLGYNNNLKHAGKLFHIQTEDSGVDHPHVITHLFTEGTILAKAVDEMTEQLRPLGPLRWQEKVVSRNGRVFEESFVEAPVVEEV